MGKQNKEILVNIFNWAEMGISIPEIMNAYDCQQNESMEHPLHNQPVKVNHISCCM